MLRVGLDGALVIETSHGARMAPFQDEAHQPAEILVAHQATFALCTISQNRRSWALRFRQAM
jgi:hypothetical protein